MSKNKLKDLPSSFGRLVNLKKLDLYGNQIKALPLSFSQLKELEFLDLKGNPLKEELAEVAGTCTNEKECKECARKVSYSIVSVFNPFSSLRTNMHAIKCYI